MISEELDINKVKEFTTNYFRTDVEIERMTSGVSTYVYRIKNDGKTYYLRVLPEDASFAAEAMAHRVMLKRGISVPEPLYFEHRNNLLCKSVMITGEIPGNHINYNDTGIENVLYEVGKQLALINSIKVDGFSWINRRIYNSLAGEKRTFSEYYYERLYTDIDMLLQYGFYTDNIKALLDNAFSMLNTDAAFLAHGDFDVSHIFQNNGQYTGIIDFGEIRGSHYLYDLGHFKLHDEGNCFIHLANGYNEVHKLTPEDYLKIDFLALFIGIGRSKYEHYRKLVKRQLSIMNNKNVCN